MILLQKESKVNQIIPDRGGLTDTIKIHHNINIKSLKVGVDIEHPFIGDLRIVLTAPNGASVTLHDREGGSADNLKTVYEGEILEDLVAQSVAGDWTLSVSDYAPRDQGTLNSWNLDINCNHTGQSEIFIPEGEDVWLVSEQVCRTLGIIEDVQVTIDIAHPFISDLIVKVKAPDGEEVTLHNRQGGSADDIERTYGMEKLGTFKGKNTEGVWTLLVRDAAPRDSGTLKYWKIAFAYQQIDDLTQVEGISAEQVAQLNGQGIYSFNKLATLGTAGIREALAGTESDFSYDGINGILDRAMAIA